MTRGGAEVKKARRGGPGLALATALQPNSLSLGFWPYFGSSSSPRFESQLAAPSARAYAPFLKSARSSAFPGPLALNHMNSRGFYEADMNRQERRKAEKDFDKNKRKMDIIRQLDKEFAAARELHQKGRLGEAEVAYKRLLEYAPGQPDVCYMLALLCRNIDDRPAAEHYLRLSLGTKPDQPHVLNELGAMQMQAGQFAAAEKLFKEALALKPDGGDILFNLGLAQKSQGRPTEAIESFKKALHEHKGFHMAHYFLGQSYAMQGQYEDAEKCFRKALELAPDQYPPILDMANVLGHMERWDEALEFARRAVELRPDHPEPLYVLGWAQENSGNEEDAEETYRDILDLNPGHMQAKVGLARLTGEGLDDAPLDPGA